MSHTDLVVDGLCGWRRSQRLVDPSSGVERHGLRGLALGPETLGKHPLLIVEILTNTHRYNLRLSDNTSFNGFKSTLTFMRLQVRHSPAP